MSDPEGAPPLDGAAAVSLILGRLGRPYDPTTVLGALTGHRRRLAAAIVGAGLATGAEAEALLDAMPRTIRSLAIATTDTPRRCYGEVRGPVLWSETVASRAASAGDTGLFVCASPARAFDTDENRTLVAALEVVRAGAEAAASGERTVVPVEVLRRARHNASRALRFLEHRSLADLPRRRPDGRALRRTRTGHRRATYAPASAMLARAADPLEAAALAGRSDLATGAVTLFATALVRSGSTERVRTGDGRLQAGVVQLRPGPGGTAQVQIGDRVVTDAVALDHALAMAR